MMGFPKPRPRLLEQRAVKADRDKVDRQERQKCRQRSGGRCEVKELGFGRCPHRATENHHLVGGIGRRNRGRSILSQHRLDVCADCHREITGHVLVPAVDEQRRELAGEVRYERVR